MRSLSWRPPALPRRTVRARLRISGAGDQQRNGGRSRGAWESPLALCGSAQEGDVQL